MYSKVKISKPKPDFMDFMLSCRIIELILHSNSILFLLKRNKILTIVPGKKESGFLLLIFKI